MIHLKSIDSVLTKAVDDVKLTLMKLNIKSIEQISQSLTNKLPPVFEQTKKDIEKNFTAILQQQFTKLDLVTREEFDIQMAVLARTRDKIKALEEMLVEQEKTR